MSPRSLTDDIDDEIDLADSATRPVGDTAAAVKPPRRRLTVHEMTIALQVAHGIVDGETPAATATPTYAPARRQPAGSKDAAADHQVTDHQVTAVDEAGEGGADRSRAALCHDALEGLSPVTPPIVAPASPDEEARPRLDEPTTSGVEERPEPWLPAHDGPVSLTGVAAPRTRTVRRSAATLDKAARRPSKQRTPAPGKTSTTLEPALAAAAVAAPPRIVIVPACGGAAATTAAVLLGAALAAVVPTVLLASGADRGALAVRADAHGGDAAQLTAWATAQQERQRSLPGGMASGDAGTGTLTLATAGRNELGAAFDPAAACDLFTALSMHRLAGVLDWSCTALPPRQAWETATHVLVTAPATSPGLLAAEYTVQTLQAVLPGSMSLSLLTVDVRGRNPRRAGRAALARLRALQLPVTSLPYDPALADEPRVHWPALRPRTRTAVTSALSQLIPEHHRKDPK